MQISIVRRDGPEEKAYIQVFQFEPEDTSMTAAGFLTWLNRQDPPRNAAGEPVEPIAWECSCMQKKCGACAMVINGRPGLACDAFLRDYPRGMRLEPLRKFPLIKDLSVDRSALFDALLKLEAWFGDSGAARGGSPAGKGSDRGDLLYDASRCLQCGLCLEVCPNYCADGSFAGMAGAVPAARVLLQTEGKKRAAMAGRYSEQVYEGCGKSLSCRNVCPAGIDIDSLLARVNRAVLYESLRARKE